MKKQTKPSSSSVSPKGRNSFLSGGLGWASFLLFSFVLMNACGDSRSKVDEGAPKKYCMSDSLFRKITFEYVRMDTVINELILSGKITFNEDKIIKVYSLASGHVGEVKVSLGDYVEAGQTLAEIQSSDVAGLSNELMAAQSDVAIAKKNLDAAEDMHKSGLLSEKEYTIAQQEYQKAISSLNKSKEIMAIYGNSGSSENTAGYTIKAPISGFIVEKNVTPGMEVRPDASTNLFTISDLKDIWAVANVYETDISKIQLGFNADIKTLGYEDKIFHGKVDKISNMLNPETKVLNVKIHLSNPDYLLKPGMFARITIRYPDQNKMLAVPKSAIIFDDNKNYVVKYNDKCNIKMQTVTVYKTSGDLDYIISDPDKNGTGMKDGDIVIGQYNLYIFTALKKL